VTTQEQILPEDSSLLKGLRVSRWVVWLVWAYVVFLIVILTLAFFLLLFNANPDAAFVEWVFRSSERAMEPFRGIFPTETVGNGSIIDFSILFAIIMYSILGMVVSAFVNFLDRKISEEKAKALYVAQEQERRREVTRTANLQQTAAQHEAAQQASAQQLAAQQAAAQQRTANAAERLASSDRTPPPDSPVDPAPPPA
jgi:uncharacterized protein YggT (Ycf19 family)